MYRSLRDVVDVSCRIFHGCCRANCLCRGFIELLTRVACWTKSLGGTSQASLENLMHLMDASSGKAKLLSSSRKSVSVRHFVYGK
jgi:hypothetical protein